MSTGFGERLRTAREAQGLSIEAVAVDTNISRRYIEALEAENFTAIPAGTYGQGFLRNYAAYLRLDADELLPLYRKTKADEQPAPQELLAREPVVDVVRPSRLLMIAAAVAVAVMLVFAAIGVVALRSFLAPKAEEEAEAPPQSTVYTLENGEREARFYAGDALSVPFETNNYRIEVSAINEFVELTAPDRYRRLGMDEAADIDLDGDGDAELLVIVVDFARNRPDIGAELRFETVASAPAEENAEEIPTVTAVSAGTAIFSGAVAYAFSVQAEFLLPCMFRWEVLREPSRRGRNERYFRRGETLNIEAQNGIRIWMSNSAAVKLQAFGGGRSVPLTTRGAAAVIVEDIHWVRGTDGYSLVQQLLDD
jgi:transcriptional regulator with XRE-family HTH domain